VVFSQPGANVTLSCFIVGSPMPEAKWVLKVRAVKGEQNENHKRLHRQQGERAFEAIARRMVGRKNVPPLWCMARKRSVQAGVCKKRERAVSTRVVEKEGGVRGPRGVAGAGFGGERGEN